MNVNPYQIKGTLDPLHQHVVCIERKEIVDQVKKGVASGEYLAIFGPRQIGKSTFLKQLQFQFDEAHYLYFDFTICPKEKDVFYSWFQKEIIKNVSDPDSADTLIKKEKIGEPELDFFNFLMALKPKFRDEKKIAFLFDEIEAIPFLNDFLNVWRRIYHETFVNRKYSVVITGSFDLVKATYGKTSPFNIAHRGYLTDFSDKESAFLIDKPFKAAGLKLEEKAREELIYKIGGHPQILQEICFRLFEIASIEKREITLLDVQNQIEQLFIVNDNFNLLKISVEKNKILENLLISIIFKKEKSQYFPYAEFTLNDAGPIIKDKDGYCKIRNPLFAEFLRGILENRVDSTIHPDEKFPNYFICLSKKDKKWFDSFSKQLNPLIHQDFYFWEEHNKTGSERLKEIVKKLEKAEYSFFIISEHSFTEKFFLEKTIYAELKKREQKMKNINFIPVPGYELYFFKKWRNSD